MPQDLPGFYYDPEKNRYFPVKGPIPGSSRKPVSSPQNSVSQTNQVPSKTKKDNRISKLCNYRELYGRVIDSVNGKVSFQEQCKKSLVSKPKIWKYQELEKPSYCSLALLHLTVETPEGQRATDALLTGGMNGSLSLFDVGDVGHYFRQNMSTGAEFVWPENDEIKKDEAVKDIWKFNGATMIFPSSVSSISMPRKEYFGVENDSSALQRAIITTLGSEFSGGALHVLNLADPVDQISSIPAIERLRNLTSFNCTIWGADISPCGHRAVVGTNVGATLVDLESGVSSMICRCKSDVLSVQSIQSGNVAICGLRNGAVVTVDARQPQRPLIRHRIPYPSSDSNRSAQKNNKPWFLLRGNTQASHTVYMPSSVCCLASLQMYDQYFLASSMDGSIKLYDHRLTKRGPVQSYEGQVNSHSKIQLATDASERFLISGGEDCKVRIWSIKSGEMLFEEKFSNSVPVTVCWQGNETICKSPSLEESQTRSCDAWLGSTDGLFRMQFCL